MSSQQRQAIDRLSDEDAQILKLGRGVIRGHTCKLLVLQRPDGGTAPSVQALRQHVDSRLDHAPRFRKRLVSTPFRVANPVWADDPDFDIACHITPIDAEHELNRAELTDLVSRLMAEPLDRTRPLWHMTVVPRVEGDAMAIVWRVHHSLADGTTCVRLASALLWDGAREGQIIPAAWQPQPGPTRWSLLASGVRARIVRGEQPRLAATRVKSIERVAIRELRPTASPTRLAKRIKQGRSVAFASLPLSQCRELGKSISDAVTINDVVLALITGAVRGWLGASASIRVKIPVSLHHAGDDPRISNHNSFFFVDLPVDEPDPVARILRINRETRERKLEHDAETLYRLGQIPAVGHLAMSPRVFTFNVSNVPGPREDVFVLGAPLRELYSVAEVSHYHALRIAVISAAGLLSFGLCADREAVPDLELIAAGIHAAADELLELAR
jgi:WS/DGAT/MGAT family acyltransferase